MPAIKPATIRKQIRNDLRDQLEAGGNNTPIYLSKLNEYMELYDHGVVLEKMAESMAGDPTLVRGYMELVREIRQIRKSMRDILVYMGISPSKELKTDYDL